MTVKKEAKKNAANAKVIIIFAVVVVIALISLCLAFLILYKPQTDTELPFSTDTNETVYPSDNDSPDDAPAASVDVTAPSTGYTAKSGVYNFLILGYDRASDNSDVMMIVNFNTNTGSVSIMQIPRDTYVENDTNSHKINVAYAAYYKRALNAGDANPELAGLEKVAAFLEQNLCINIHYQAVMDLDGFRNIVDIIGGVDVDIPEDMYYEDPEQDLYINFKAGVNHLDGEHAEQFVRFRSGYLQADIGRVNAQKIFMTAFIRTVKEELTVDKVAKLVDEIMSNIDTNITAKDMVYFAKKVLSVDLGNITMMTMPGIDAYVNKVSYYVMNRPLTLESINNYFNVYNIDISDAIFDKNFTFTEESEYEVYQKYLGNSDYVIDDKYTADEIEKDSINIP